MAEFYDNLETRDPEERERALFDALSAHLEKAGRSAPGLAEILEGVDPETIRDREALARLPVTRKSDLPARQSERPPFAGLAATPVGELARVFASPGPIYEPEGRGEDYWRMARALFAAGFRRGDLIHNTFSYHFSPAGSMLESGALALGCAVFPAGVGQTELQVQAIAHLAPRGYVGTPSFLKIILDKAAELKADVSSLERALVGGEALPPSLRDEFSDRGLAVLQCYASADLGLIAYESEAMEGMIMEEAMILEIVRPGTGDPVPDGEVGEVVVTPLNAVYPLVRFATGDLSAVLAGQSPCGRTNVRIKGWMGRADQTTKVRGLFVHPSQIDAVVKRHPSVRRARLVVSSVDNQDRMTLRCEIEAETGEALSDQIAATVREICKLRAEIVPESPGALPNDGKIIEDARSYE